MRRAVLVLLGVGLVASLATRVGAQDPSYEVDGEVYAGQSHGGWTCGPRATARYGGVGARVRVSERPASAENGAGIYGTLGAVGEYELVEITRCPEGQRCETPPNHLMFGGGVQGGYRDEWLGASVGVLAFQGWADDASQSPDWSSFPLFELSFGKESGFHVPLGFGAPIVSTYRRPAVVYTGPRYVMRTWRLELLGGLYRAGPSNFSTVHLRFDAAPQFRIARDLWLGPHAAIATEGRPIDAETGLRLGASY